MADPLSALKKKKEEESAKASTPTPAAEVPASSAEPRKAAGGTLGLDEVSAVLGARSRPPPSSTSSSSRATQGQAAPQPPPPPPPAPAQTSPLPVQPQSATPASLSSGYPQPAAEQRVATAAPSSPSVSATPPVAARSTSGAAGGVKSQASSSGPITFDGMLPGESVTKATQAVYFTVPKPFHEIEGRILVTPYRLRFQPKKGCLREEVEWMKTSGFFECTLGAIEEIRKDKSTTTAGALENKLQVVTKDTRTLTFVAPGGQGTKDLAEVADAYAAFSAPATPLALFAGKFAQELGVDHYSSDGCNGWHLYDPAVEFARMGIETDDFPNPASPWKMSNINNRYGLCETYPALIALPRNMTPSELSAVAQFRKKRRLPVMSWCGGPELQFASIWRCSQTTEGFNFLKNNFCPEDQKLVSLIRTSVGKERDLLLIDLRPWKSAMANKATGGGYEGYERCNLVFGNIDNIHAVLSGYKAMAAAVAAVEDGAIGSWVRDVANSNWYDYIGAILHCCTRVIGEIMEHKKSCMVHCSDGWDRTAQTTSISMLCLDSQYRTLRGFLLLIQKEWCSFGHKFRTRLALGEAKTSEYSPVFVQWLECVFQIWQQHPTAFEWTPALLLCLATEVFSNRFGTFLCDCEKERQAVANSTLSFWAFILSPEEAPKYTNPRYARVSGPIVPSPCQARFVVWDAFWFRYHLHGNRAKTVDQGGSQAPMVAPGTPATASCQDV
mmetsp:Transcript_52000/g.123804  ORF Transcript_52000/g.123804 Transcript_52000/m.123804 type:complete len:726 (+) Transcript_52000:95-2272(+)